MTNLQEDELNQDMWAVVTHDKVLFKDISYKDAEEAVKVLVSNNPNYANEATIVTSEAASKMIRSFPIPEGYLMINDSTVELFGLQPGDMHWVNGKFVEVRCPDNVPDNPICPIRLHDVNKPVLKIFDHEDIFYTEDVKMNEYYKSKGFKTKIIFMSEQEYRDIPATISSAKFFGQLKED